MLSFLREQELECGVPEGQNDRQDTNNQLQGTKQEQSDAQAQQQEYITVTPQDKNVRKTTILLVVSFVVGVLCLWFMIKKSVPLTAAAAGGSGGTEEARIEAAIAQLTGIRLGMFSSLEKIVNKFYEFSDVQQVKISELVRNPFKMDGFSDDLTETSDMKEMDSDKDAEMDRLQQARNMRLLSIMRAQQGNCCMIDDKILYEGDVIGSFTVRKIEDNLVKLEWRGRREGNKWLSGTEIILKLSE